MSAIFRRHLRLGSVLAIYLRYRPCFRHCLGPAFCFVHSALSAPNLVSSIAATFTLALTFVVAGQGCVPRVSHVRIWAQNCRLPRCGDFVRNRRVN